MALESFAAVSMANFIYKKSEKAAYNYAYLEQYLILFYSTETRELYFCQLSRAAFERSGEAGRRKEICKFRTESFRVVCSPLSRRFCTGVARLFRNHEGSE